MLLKYKTHTQSVSRNQVVVVPSVVSWLCVHSLSSGPFPPGRVWQLSLLSALLNFPAIVRTLWLGCLVTGSSTWVSTAMRPLRTWVTSWRRWGKTVDVVRLWCETGSHLAGTAVLCPERASREPTWTEPREVFTSALYGTYFKSIWAKCRL